jgi:hypothetical protein
MGLAMLGGSAGLLFLLGRSEVSHWCRVVIRLAVGVFQMAKEVTEVRMGVDQ